MSESKFTPGPWECEFRSMSLPVIRSGLERIAIVDFCGGYGLVNARLIAAAPDMYEALTDLIECIIIDIGNGIIGTVEWNKARAAIAKAEGRNE